MRLILPRPRICGSIPPLSLTTTKGVVPDAVHHVYYIHLHAVEIVQRDSGLTPHRVCLLGKAIEPTAVTWDVLETPEWLGGYNSTKIEGTTDTCSCLPMLFTYICTHSYSNAIVF